MPDNQTEELVFHLRSYGDVSASDLDYYAAKHSQSVQAQQAAQGAPADMLTALKDAVEGECHGLLITDAQAKAILEHTLAATPAQQVEPLTVPHPGSEQASKAINAEIEARGWPSSTSNAARAGYEACRKLAGAGIKGST